MAVLTWRNVDAPNLTPALDGIRTAGAMINHALTNAKAGIDDFTQARQEQADRAILGRSLAITDPEKLQAGLADGSVLGPEAQYASPEMMRSASSRVGSLLDQAGQRLNQQVNRQGLDESQYKFGRMQSTNRLYDAAGPDIMKIGQLLDQGDSEAAMALAQKNPHLSQLPGQELFRLYKDMGTTAADAYDRSLRSTNMEQDQTRFGWEQDKRRQDQAVEAAYAQISAHQLPEVASKALSDLASTADPAVFIRTRDRLREAFGKDFGAGISPSSRPLTMTEAPLYEGSAYKTVFGNGKFGQPSQDVDTLPMGQVAEFGKTMIANTKGKIGQTDAAGNALGTSATGAHQITRDTLLEYGPKVFGDQWATLPYSPQNQTKLAQAIFEDRKGGDLTKTWAGLATPEMLKIFPDAKKPGFFANMSFKDVEPYIIKSESGGRPLAAGDVRPPATGDLPSAASAANSLKSVTADIERAGADIAGSYDGFISKYRPLLGSKKGRDEVINEMTKGDGPFPSGNRELLDRRIGELLADGVPNPEIAGAMLAHGKRERGGLGAFAGEVYNSLPLYGRTNDVGNNRWIDGGVVDTLLQGFKSGKMAQHADALDTLDTAKATMAAAYNDFLEKDKMYANVVRAGQTNGRIDPYLDTYKEIRDRSLAQYKLAAASAQDKYGAYKTKADKEKPADPPKVSPPKPAGGAQPSPPSFSLDEPVALTPAPVATRVGSPAGADNAAPPSQGGSSPGWSFPLGKGVETLMQYGRQSVPTAQQSQTTMRDTYRQAQIHNAAVVAARVGTPQAFAIQADVLRRQGIPVSPEDLRVVGAQLSQP